MVCGVVTVFDSGVVWCTNPPPPPPTPTPLPQLFPSDYTFVVQNYKCVDDILRQLYGEW